MSYLYCFYFFFFFSYPQAFPQELYPVNFTYEDYNYDMIQDINLNIYEPDGVTSSLTNAENECSTSENYQERSVIFKLFTKFMNYL